MRYFYVVIWGLGGGLGVQAQALTSPTQLAPDSGQYKVAADQRRVSSETDSTGTCLEVLRGQAAAGLVRVFYPSGHLKEYIPYGDLAAGRRHGLVTTWFASGQLHTQQAYQQGQRAGTLLVYYETGALRRRTEYVAGSELPGTCFDAAGQPVAYFPYEQLPVYPGGQAQLTKELTTALRLPRQLLRFEFLTPLLVELALQVAEDGSIRASRVARSSAVAMLDQAVLAAVAKLTRRFSPARLDGQLVAATYYLPVQLTLSSPPKPIRH